MTSGLYTGYVRQSSAMRYMWLEIDEERLARAQEVLGTSGVEDTVESALQEVVHAALRRRLAARIRSGEGIDRGDHVFEASRSQHR